MRKSTRITNPLFAISAYYIAIVLLVQAITYLFPAYAGVLPFGGVEALMDQVDDDMEVIATVVTAPLPVNRDTLSLAMGIVGAVLLMAPISWVYFITTRTKRVDRSFAQTMVVLPIIVAGIAMIVQHSVALAFSLAGVVAAVRFRFSLEEPAHALYVFVSIAIGLAAGIGGLEIAFITSLGFVYTNLLLWKLDYGADLTTPYFSFLTGRGRDDNEL